MSGFFKLLGRMARHIGFALVGYADRSLTPAVRTRMQGRIAASETRHTGQLRIYVESSLPLSYLSRNAAARERAITLFGKLRVWDTENNNGVLIYLLMAEHAIEVVADRGLNQHVSPKRWAEMISRMRIPLREGQWEEGLMLALDEVSAQLEALYPARPGTTSSNELPDAPIIR